MHLLTGKPPSELLGPNMELRFAGQVALSTGFLAFLQKLTAREHASRFSSAALALRALRALEGAPHGSDEKREGIAAFADLFVWELQQERRERRWRRGLIAGVVGLVLLGVIGSAAEMYSLRPHAAARPALSRAQPPAPRKHGYGLHGPTWKAPFGDVNVTWADFDPLPNELAIDFLIPYSAEGIQLEQLQARLAGPAGTIEPDPLHVEDTRDWRRLRIYFRLPRDGAMPTELVFGDGIRVSLGLEPFLDVK